VNYWVITQSQDEAFRWQSIFKSLGLSYMRGITLNELKEETGGAVLAIIDWDMISSGPKSAINSIRARIPKIHVILFASESDMMGTAAAQILDVGALDFFATNSAAVTLREKLLSHIRRLDPKGADMDRLENGNIRVDVRRRYVFTLVRDKWTQSESLAPKEFEILCLLLKNPNSPLSREHLMNVIWGEKSTEINSEAVDQQVASLRKKLSAAGKRIQSLRGVGYQLKTNR